MQRDACLTVGSSSLRSASGELRTLSSLRLLCHPLRFPPGGKWLKAEATPETLSKCPEPLQLWSAHCVQGEGARRGPTPGQDVQRRGLLGVSAKGAHGQGSGASKVRSSGAHLRLSSTGVYKSRSELLHQVRGWSRQGQNVC